MKAIIKSAVFGLLLVAFVIAPVAVSAQQPSANQNQTSGFCNRLNNSSATITQKLADLEAQREAKRLEVQNKLKERRTERETKVKDQRQEGENKFEQNLDALESEAATPEKRQAIETFRTTIKAAMAVRKSAVDAAQTTFRTEVDKLVTQRQTSVNTAVATFKNSVQTAMQKAKADCAAGITSATVRQNLTTAMKAAKDSLRADLKALDKIGPQISALAESRNQAVRQANEAFKVSMEQARATLKVALPNS